MVLLFVLWCTLLLVLSSLDSLEAQRSKVRQRRRATSIPPRRTPSRGSRGLFFLLSSSSSCCGSCRRETANKQSLAAVSRSSSSSRRGREFFIFLWWGRSKKTNISIPIYYLSILANFFVPKSRSSDYSIVHVSVKQVIAFLPRWISSSTKRRFGMPKKAI